MDNIGDDESGVTRKAVKYRGKPGRHREQPCLHREGVGAIPARSGNIIVSAVINVRYEGPRYVLVLGR